MSAIRVRSGPLFDLVNPDPALVRIEDIAHALAHICRFTGHTNCFYSVAQHSVLVSELVPKGFELWGLLHDAAEAYIGDVSSPLKSLLPDYKQIEQRMEEAVWGKFGLRGPLPKQVKDADNAAYNLERTAYMVYAKNLAWSPEHSRYMFLHRFQELTKPIYEMAVVG